MKKKTKKEETIDPAAHKKQVSEEELKRLGIRPQKKKRPVVDEEEESEALDV